MTFLQKIDRLPLYHHLVRGLRLRQLAAMFLHHFPRQHVLPGGVRYRCSGLEAILLSDEIFNRQVYLKAIDVNKVRTFADLGCNVGYFAVLMASLSGRRDFQGLEIDANPEMVEEARWHLVANGLHKVIPLPGLVGAENAGENADFYILPSNAGSSQYPIYEPGKPPKGRWKRISAPNLNLESAWLQNVGDVRCHILKVDIEGSEKMLFQNEQKFLQRVDAIILEWHKWIVSRETIDACLAEQGFRLAEILEELYQTGIAWYVRKAH
jgi:FkbM family methyltransferase